MERELAGRDMDPDIEALCVEHVLHVLEGLELSVLRTDVREKIAAVGEEF